MKKYALPPHGIHGVAHWARVMENGLRLAEATGANSDIIQLFALFHDACRINEGRDACHAVRGAMLASDSWNVLYNSLHKNTTC